MRINLSVSNGSLFALCFSQSFVYKTLFVPCISGINGIIKNTTIAAVIHADFSLLTKLSIPGWMY
ncbi:hypothetical protein RFZ45_01195, partial [Acinetobacter baumannii]|nr:hypothetical protein [Acinetobacter baumannii]